MEKRYPEFRGMMPIMPTTVTPDGEVDLAAQVRIVDYLLDCGAVAIGHMGGASEYFKVAEDDRGPIIQTVVERVKKRVPIFVGVTAMSMKQTLKNAREAYALGADLLMVCSPVMGVMKRAELLKFYEAIAAETPLPIIVQDTGASSGVYSGEFMAELAEKIPTIGYAKAEGGGFLRKTVDLQRLTDGAIQVIGGAGGSHMLALLRQNVTAFMTGTEALDLHGAVVQAFLEGDEDKATDLYYTTVLPYLSIYNTNGRHLLKYMLVKRGILENDTLLFPYDTAPTDPLMLAELDIVLDRIARNAIVKR
ncbi:MAG: dihydrodipicolinate synthase family protein [Clostridia bacterium]|nr:dihydrodipicolinate synthase family protein [Clostridia bacterium]